MKFKKLVYIKYIVHVLIKQKFTLSLLVLNSMWHFSITEKYIHPPPPQNPNTSFLQTQDFFLASTELMEQNASIQVVSES